MRGAEKVMRKTYFIARLPNRSGSATKQAGLFDGLCLHIRERIKIRIQWCDGNMEHRTGAGFARQVDDVHGA